jgi:threonine aldolase
MTTLNRRRFLELGSVAGGLGVFGSPGFAFGSAQRVRGDAAQDPDDRVVRLSGDGLGLTPAQYSRLLTHLAEEKGIVPDTYILEGVVDELEKQFARILGKERAVFMPTGTLANHLAVRALAGGSSRAIVQSESHLYQDTGDCVQTLSNITLMPLAPGRATFTADEVQQLLDQTRTGRVASRVSVISMETPVRRKQGATFDPVEMKKVIALARREGIRLHLDGARLFLEAAYAGKEVAEYTQPFDTVYVSLYKYFNAASGAILAGPRELLDSMYHVRRMFGGALSQAWPFAAVALHYLTGFSDRFSRAIRSSDELIRALSKHDAFTIDRIPSGTNLFRLRVSGTDATVFQKRLAAVGVVLPAPSRDGAFLIGVNETLNRMPAASLADTFRRAIAS